MWTDISKSMWTHIEIVLPFVYERDWVQNYVTESQFSWSQSIFCLGKTGIIFHESKKNKR